MATDIAFVVGCLAILGNRVPRGLRVLLLSLAIADDIGAILVIAVGYTETLYWTPLLLAFAGIGAVLGLARLGVRSMAVYVLVGTGVWLAFHDSGIHATLAGVILGLITPTRAWVAHSRLGSVSEQVRSYLHGESWESAGQRLDTLRDLETAARETLSPLERIEHSMHPWSSFVIMPIFALANAGVPIEFDLITDPVATAVAVGLVAGKPLGILVASFLAVKTGIGDLPEGVGWASIVGAGLLAGIGFTMALFIAGLALDGDSLGAAKLGILGASLLAAVAGMGVLFATLPRDAATD